MDLTIGLVMLGIGIGLVVIGRPDRNGASPRFLQFEASPMLYAPFVIIFLVGGSAEIVTSILGIHGW